MEAREQSVRLTLASNFPQYASACLKIRTKSGAIQPLIVNRAQLYTHIKLEEQKAKTGKVRALILKGRQQGMSTYVGGRFYHRISHSFGYRAFILTHTDDATENLFEMAKRYHEYCPDLVKPVLGASNAKEMNFPKLGGGYKVGTAGSRGTGRSSTMQLFHGSEVAFWPFAETHFAGAMQAVPESDGTEIILESTANGVGNLFHKKWQDAETGIGDFIAIFVPWFWQDEYSRKPDADFKLSDEEQLYADVHKVSLGQMAWRRNKIAELGDLMFRQEYPATAAEAFVITGSDSFIKPESVLRARKADLEGIGPLVLGVDPARFGDDGFAICWRRGRKVIKVERRYKLDNVQGASWVKTLIDEDKPDRVFIDVGGVGSGVVDVLKSWGEPYANLCRGINFGSEPQEPTILLNDGTKRPGPKNRRAEMWKRSKDWLEEPGGVDIPDEDALHTDACGPGYSYDANQRLLLESKEHMRSRGVKSPDGWDAVVLTFAEPVAPAKPKVMPKIPASRAALSGRSGAWMG